MRSIGFFGDSFCASNRPESWCNILQRMLRAQRIRWFGEEGRSVWSTMMNFNRLIDTNKTPDICVFCWTDPHRLYHPDLILTPNCTVDQDRHPGVYKALKHYWKYLHNPTKHEMEYEYALRYYDSEVLGKLKNRIIVQMWSFKPKNEITLNTGTFINESIFEFSKKDKSQTGKINHMTIAQNKEWAERVYGRLTI